MKKIDKIVGIFLLLIIGMNLFGCESSRDTEIVENYYEDLGTIAPETRLDLTEYKLDPRMVSVLEKPIKINTYKKLECIRFIVGNEAYYHYFYS